MLLALEFGHSILKDVIYGARVLRKDPALTVIALLSLTIGIGANTSTFSAAKRLVYDGLNVPRPGELRILHWVGDENVAVHSFLGDVETHGTNTECNCFSYPVCKLLQQHFASLFAFKDFDANATIKGTAQQVQAAMVSGNYYAALEITPQIGRPKPEACSRPMIPSINVVGSHRARIESQPRAVAPKRGPGANWQCSHTQGEAQIRVTQFRAC